MESNADKNQSLMMIQSSQLFMKASLRESLKKPQTGPTPQLLIKSLPEHDIPFDRQSTIQSNRDTL